MKIGIVSDTHKNRELLDTVVAWMVQRQKIATLYHLGDDYADVVGLDEQFSEIVQVPGIYDERYKSGELPAKVFESIIGITIMLVHSLEKDVDKSDIGRSDIILHGHTHKFELRIDDGKLFFNPGHLKGLHDKNMAPTFGILTIGDRDLSAAIYGLDFKPVQSISMIRSESGLYRAG
jgi:putative phosphoesterase